MLTPQNTIALTAALILSLALIINTAHDPLTVSLGFSVLAFASTWWIIPQLEESFRKANLTGKDINKKEKPLIPESMGFVAATVYLVCLFLFIPFPFMEWLNGTYDNAKLPESAPLSLMTFPFNKLIEFLSALSTIQSMVLLGFADDIFDIRWRNKLLLPMIASIPLLMTYHTNHGITDISIPLQLRPLLGAVVNIGWLYYIYMALLAIFCTHSINILAGINGVEAGQTLVIAVSVCINDWLYVSGIKQYNGNPASVEAHLFSLYMLMPFVGVTLGLLMHNWYPSRVFVGDTFCYFAGMTFAVVGILGHFSKTLLLFFLPQIFNFLYSCPQLFRLLHCPRHRMPALNAKTNLLEPTTINLIAHPPRLLGRLIIDLFSYFGLARVERDNSGAPKSMTNLTLINLILVRLGPMRERDVTVVVTLLQVMGSVIAFALRYWAVRFVYEIVN